MRRAGAGVEINKFGRSSQTSGGYGSRDCVFGRLVHEGCVLIKLLLRLLHCRERLDRPFVAFDMSLWQLLWFVKLALKIVFWENPCC